MKYSELDAYLELARWENERDDYHLKVYRNGYTVAEVGLWEQYNIKILDPTQMTWVKKATDISANHYYLTTNLVSMVIGDKILNSKPSSPNQKLQRWTSQASKKKR